MKMIRQGDVLLRPLPDLAMPIRPRPVPQKPDRDMVVLARGEATGHHHAVLAKNAELCHQGGRAILSVFGRAALTHQEHAPIDLEVGLYEVIPQREYVPASASMPARWTAVRD